MTRYSYLIAGLALLLALSCQHDAPPPEGDFNGWPVYAGSKAGIRYSSNRQANTENVHQLQRAWEYDTGDKSPDNRSQIQCNPIVVDGVLYGTSPQSRLFALNAATGEPLWVFGPYTAGGQVRTPEAVYQISRGATYWQDEQGGDKRIFYSVGPRLYCVDAEKGTMVTGFGGGGYIDLREKLDADRDLSGAYAVGTSPGIIYKDMLIVGMRLSEDAGALPGHIRAFDARTGERRWIFHTIPHPGELGYDSWDDPEAWKRAGGANNWAGMALDEERGIVYVPTGSASPDFWGGRRKGQNLFANSLLALDAATGKYIWHYQVVHHDLWDRDLPATPNLITVHHDGRAVDAVAQITKHGYVFLFDRVNGKPLFPIEERPVPTQALPGEAPWPAQPAPTLPEPFARQRFGPGDVTQLSPETHAYMLERYRKVQSREPFTPPSKGGVWIFPGFDGGGEWGGAAVDPATQILYVNSSELPWSLTMVDRPEAEAAQPISRGQFTYMQHCMACHGAERQGFGDAFPALAGIGKRYKEPDIRAIIDNGRNMMPAFPQISAEEKAALLDFLLGRKETGLPVREPAPVPGGGTAELPPYIMTGYHRFLDDDGYPGITPPWGTLNAVDLNSGRLLWKVPLGEYPELTARGIPPTGTENYGGPVVTAGGLVFIAATKDEKIRAFDKTNGRVLWEAELPAAGYATPAVYSIDGRQYIVIACGGGKIGSKSGSRYVAFALP
ncbi:MAG: PQQ-binding-like beta-propeller repeat protein [Phaeodactylibacter sp.]|nr:PQQ-binding-like beta-propeller repeat protein [Phaeodactylibacter sp.]